LSSFVCGLFEGQDVGIRVKHAGQQFFSFGASLGRGHLVVAVDDPLGGVGTEQFTGDGDGALDGVLVLLDHGGLVVEDQPVAEGTYGVVEVLYLGIGVGEISGDEALDGPEVLDDLQQPDGLLTDFLAGGVDGHAHAQLGVPAGEFRIGVPRHQQGFAVAERLVSPAGDVPAGAHFERGVPFGGLPGPGGHGGGVHRQITVPTVHEAAGDGDADGGEDEAVGDPREHGGDVLALGVCPGPVVRLCFVREHAGAPIVPCRVQQGGDAGPGIVDVRAPFLPGGQEQADQDGLGGQAAWSGPGGFQWREFVEDSAGPDQADDLPDMAIVDLGGVR
jgi:hypothetical protein